MMTPENTIYFEPGNPDLELFARHLAAAVSNEVPFRIHFDLNNGILAMKAKASTPLGMWTPALFGDEDPTIAPRDDSNVIPFPSHLRD